MTGICYLCFFCSPGNIFQVRTILQENLNIFCIGQFYLITVQTTSCRLYIPWSPCCLVARFRGYCKIAVLLTLFRTRYIYIMTTKSPIRADVADRYVQEFVNERAVRQCCLVVIVVSRIVV